MYLYEDADRWVHTWNAVDVEIDGLRQHGLVVGLEENGSTPPRLLVDFECPTQRSVVVPHGKVWQCYPYPIGLVRNLRDVEALLHDGPHRPWTWYPGRVLIPYFEHRNEVSLVEVMVSGELRPELIPYRQIRDPGAEERFQGKLVAVDHLVIRTCDVSNGYWTLEPSVATWLLRRAEKRFDLRFTKVLNQQMHYVRLREESPMWWNEFTGDVAGVFEKERNHPDYYYKLLEITKKRGKPSDYGEQYLALPVELLKEVFHSLDTVHRQRCRRTCPLWEALLTSAELCQEVRVTRKRPSRLPRVRWDCNYAMYGCIFKHITPATRTISIRDTDPSPLHLEHIPHAAGDVVDVMVKVLDTAGIRIERFISCRQSIWLREEIFDQWKLSALSIHIAALHAKLVSSCQRLIVKEYSLTVVKMFGRPLMKSRIPLVAFSGGQVDAARIVELLEQGLHWEEPPLDVQRLADCMANGIDSEEKAKGVKKILWDFQTRDPRPSSAYRNRKWTVYNVAGVDVSRLNRFCLNALSRYTQDWCPASVGGSAQYVQSSEPGSEVSDSSSSESDDGED
ncbi:uncharacterized protein LOC129599034 [Paramacrobiotus metropolitanus]|uniref:uncharacterized protein LOC129599034 n=1 Tax=Paramacrobiotus metropolitanus TaxID=2943436 RepID=UPI002445E8F6|nr:uncharacterized protein LOC129599034 [Paramacrobiotus metropolitanus]